MGSHGFLNLYSLAALTKHIDPMSSLNEVRQDNSAMLRFDWVWAEPSIGVNLQACIVMTLY